MPTPQERPLDNVNLNIKESNSTPPLPNKMLPLLKVHIFGMHAKGVVLTRGVYLYHESLDQLEYSHHMHDMHISISIFPSQGSACSLSFHNKSQHLTVLFLYFLAELHNLIESDQRF